MRVLQFIIIAIFLAVAMTSCDEDGSMSSSMGFSLNKDDIDNSYVMEDNQLEQVTIQKTKKRLNRNLSFVKLQLKRINNKLETENLELDSNAKEISEQLSKDLVRLKEDLETRLSNLNKITTSKHLHSDYGIERMEDEISQIQEQIDDWIEINFEHNI